MKINFLQKPTIEWNKRIEVSKEYPRSWVVLMDLDIKLSNGTIINVPKDYVWDGASIPRWLWWLFKPIDEGAIGDLIHDYLWDTKQHQLETFEYDIHKARKFADDERLLWREFLAPKKKIKNYITHFVVRLAGGLFYSRQIKIPN